MKYLEELSLGDTFEFENQLYVLTQDYRKRKEVFFSCCNLRTGAFKWIAANATVNLTPIYTYENSVIEAVKPTNKEVLAT